MLARMNEHVTIITIETRLGFSSPLSHVTSIRMWYELDYRLDAFWTTDGTNIEKTLRIYSFTIKWKVSLCVVLRMYESKELC